MQASGLLRGTPCGCFEMLRLTQLRRMLNTAMIKICKWIWEPAGIKDQDMWSSVLWYRMRAQRLRPGQPEAQQQERQLGRTGSIASSLPLDTSNLHETGQVRVSGITIYSRKRTLYKPARPKVVEAQGKVTTPMWKHQWSHWSSGRHMG